ncbi:MAG: hypothetical protein QGI88_07620 [SAR202 cluster bacterium]|nr:hypothetical protein [SAR202 cluster bacterium]MDP7224214.1 hypothetical protein [SAR202 cluster bacterium]MDP7533623.1 hypothetical protein [SAR202 cluster bacterium]
MRGEPVSELEVSTLGIEISHATNDLDPREVRPFEVTHPTEPSVTMQLNTWDFGGQDIYHATHQFFLTERSLFVLVWNARYGYEQGKLYDWLDTIQAKAPKSLVLVGSDPYR